LAGLVPAIHAAPLQETFEVGGFRTAWMPGTSPGKTRESCGRLRFCNLYCRTGQPRHKAGHDVQDVQKAEYYYRIRTFERPCIRRVGNPRSHRVRHRL